MRRLVSFLLALSLALSLVGCAKDKRVEYCELGIVLPREFEPYEADGFHAAYSDGVSFVGITRYSFVDCVENGLLTTWTPTRFAEVYLEMMEREVDEGIRRHGDVPYFSYTMESSSGEELMYMPTFYRTQYAYFVITFITPKGRETSGRVEFLGYTETVYIINTESDK